jgi:hypothetical protein
VISTRGGDGGGGGAIAACARARQVSWIVWGLSVALYAIGFFFAFLAASVFS